MDKFLERIANALETIAAALTEIAGPGRVNTLATSSPATTVDMMMPGQEVKTAKPGRPAKPAKEEKPATTAAPSDKPVVLADVAEVVRKLVATGADGHGKATTVLGQFGAKRISEIKAEDFPKVIEKINELLKAVKK